MLKESLKAQDETKKRHLQAFDKMAQKGGGTITFFLECFVRKQKPYEVIISQTKSKFQNLAYLV